MADHGTYACYVSGCRLPQCRRANTLYMRGYRQNLRGADLTAFTTRKMQNGDERRSRRTGATWYESTLPI